MAGRRCAEWRFPTTKQQKVEETARRLDENQRRRVSVDDEDAWWASVLADPSATTAKPRADRTLAEIRSSELKVECLKCFRIVTVSREEALRRYDGNLAMEAGRRAPARRRLRAQDRALRRRRLLA